MKRGKEARGGIRRLWDLVMKFGGEFGGHGDTSFHPACIPLTPFAFVLFSSFNANAAVEEKTIPNGIGVSDEKGEGRGKTNRLR